MPTLKDRLFAAVAKGDSVGVKDLIAKGAKVNSVGDNKITPLHVAAHRGDQEMAALLIENGAKVNAKNEFEQTPLDVALAYRRTKVAELLENPPTQNKRTSRDSFGDFRSRVVETSVRSGKGAIEI